MCLNEWTPCWVAPDLDIQVLDGVAWVTQGESVEVPGLSTEVIHKDTTEQE